MTTFAAAQQAVHGPQRRGLGAALARRIFSQIACGRLTIILPDGSRMSHDSGRPGPDAVFEVRRWRAFRRLFLGGHIGFAEAYIDNDWDSPDVTALVEIGALSQEIMPAAREGTWPVRLTSRLLHRLNTNTKAGSRRNITRHYDLGNEFYQAWLDRGMSYSSALFAHDTETLDRAQTRKQDRVLDLLDLRPGMRVLEIGCGWGGLAERIAQAGCAVTGITLSPSQQAFATARLSGAGLGRSANILLQDYRDIRGEFDRVVSIEMIEAVGEAWWPRYFETLGTCLAPGGRAVIQAITIHDAKFEDYRRSSDFIQRYVFPGGMLPSPGVIHGQAAAAGLAAELAEAFGASYAHTLAHWRARFEDSWPRIAALGFSENFRRLWRYYLCYCEAGFRCRQIDVGLWVLRPGAC